MTWQLSHSESLGKFQIVGVQSFQMLIVVLPFSDIYTRNTLDGLILFFSHKSNARDETL